MKKKKNIKRAFLSAKYRRGTWKDFEKHAIEHFKKRNAANSKHTNFLLKKYLEFETLCKCIYEKFNKDADPDQPILNKKE